MYFYVPLLQVEDCWLNSKGGDCRGLEYSSVIPQIDRQMTVQLFVCCH